jgi:hypothetical protein
VGGEHRSQRAGSDEEERQGDGGRGAIAGGKTAEPPGPLLLDHPLSIRVERHRRRM